MAHWSRSAVPSYDWMVFVDGENFTLRGQRVANSNNLVLQEGDCYSKDTFLWIPDTTGRTSFSGGHLFLALQPIRSFYYTSLVGDNDRIENIRNRLWDLHFNPVIFKKSKKRDEAKGVDIALTKDLLTNAFYNNYDVALLYAGDGDYVPVVEEVKRMGKVVHLIFFKNEGLNLELKLACDSFCDITATFIQSWQKYQS